MSLLTAAATHQPIAIAHYKLGQNIVLLRHRIQSIPSLWPHVLLNYLMKSA